MMYILFSYTEHQYWAKTSKALCDNSEQKKIDESTFLFFKT